MQTITLPIWAFATAVGLPGICLIWMIIALVRSLRKADIEASLAPAIQLTNASTSNPGRFSQELIALQIDTVFSGLVALIETERIKLKTLMGHSTTDSGGYAASLPCEHVFDHASEEAPSGKSSNRIGQRVAQAMANGQGVEAAAAQLGMSHAEVELSMKLNEARNSRNRRKLEAVA